MDLVKTQMADGDVHQVHRGTSEMEASSLTSNSQMPMADTLLCGPRSCVSMTSLQLRISARIMESGSSLLPPPPTVSSAIDGRRQPNEKTREGQTESQRARGVEEKGSKRSVSGERKKGEERKSRKE